MSIDWVLSIIIGAIVGAVLTIVVQEILHPPLKYKINKTIKSITKRIRDPTVPTRYYLKSEELIGTHISEEDFITKVKSLLYEKGYLPEVIGGNLKIKNFRYENTNAEVTITLGFGTLRLNKEPEVRYIGIEVYGHPHYNTFYEEVLAFSQIGNLIKDIIGKAAGIPISMIPSITCEINHLDNITAVLSDMKMTYVALRDGYNIELGKKTATIYRMVGPEGIRSLKTLIQLYH
jgi:hypothetical protein